MPKTRYGVFLSSTDDLAVRKYRLAAKGIIEEEEFSDKWYPVEMSDFDPDTASAPEKCKARVLECDVYVGLLGPFYGSVAPGQDLSFTEYEYTVARDNGLHIGIFLLPEREIFTESPPERIKQQGSFMSRQEDFKAQVQKAHVVNDEIKDLEHFKERFRKYMRSLPFPPVRGTETGGTDKPVPFLGESALGLFDRRPVRHYTIDALDQELLYDYLQSEQVQTALGERGLLRAPILKRLQAMGLCTEKHPLFGTFLAFAPYNLITEVFGASSLHMVAYDSTERADAAVIQKEEISDNLLRLYDAGMTFLRKNLRRRGAVRTEDRDDLEIPVKALAEALANALVHRDYESLHLQEQPTRIEIYSDRVEIVSFGGLVPGVSLETLNENPEDITPRRRNGVIAKIFLHMQLVELGGSGVSRMHRECERAHVPLPEITVRDDMVKVVFRRSLGRHVFICHSGKDYGYVRKLVNVLLKAGFDVWFDDSNIIIDEPGWSDIISRAIQECAAFIVVWSPNTAVSMWARREILYAQHLDKPIFPINLGGKPMLVLIGLQHYNATDGRLPDERFLDTLARYAPRRQNTENGETNEHDD